MAALRLLVVIACAIGAAFAQQVGAPTDDLDRLSVDELFKVQVTSVGRKAQQLSKSAAAAFVLTAEDIRRSGATCIPEALQWVPGLTVLRTDGRSWVVSARGSARLYSNKILVMIDGRSLYTPLFSGVIWDSIDVPLDDIERIEIVRGPGAVMWGPNAVNGVINIITKQARSTQGATAAVAAGNELRGDAEVRWGAAPSDQLAYRVWGKLDYRSPGWSSPGYYSIDDRFPYQSAPLENLDSASGRLGFRLDGQPTRKDQWTVQGDLYKRDRQDPLAYAILLPEEIGHIQGHTDYHGGYLQTKWTRSSSPDSESVLQFCFDRSDINYAFVGGDTNNVNLDFQKRKQTGDRNEIYWGVGYQQYWDSSQPSGYISFSPSTSVFRMGDATFRDEWQFVPGRLVGSAGVRLDYSSRAHFEYEPSVRLLYTPSSRQSAWMAVSRAIREPSRFDRDMVWNGGSIDVGFPVSVVGSGSRTLRPETERSVEAGYRFQSSQRWSVDASVFWSYYRSLLAYQSPKWPVLAYQDGNPILEYITSPNNLGSGRSYGAEVWAVWQVLPRWRVIPSYSYLRETAWVPAGTCTVSYGWDSALATLRHQAWLRSQFDLSRTLHLDVMARARSRDGAYNLPGVLLMDVRLGWRPTRAGELSFSVEDLANRHVLESYSEGPFPAIPLRRTFVVKWSQRL